MKKNVIAILVMVLAAACDKKGDDIPRPDPKTVEKSAARAEKPKVAPLPVKAFVELDTAQLAFKPQNVLGRQPADIAKDLPQFIRKDKTSEAVKKQTAAMMKDLEKEVAALGVDTKKARPDVEFRLPPTPASTGEQTHVILHTHDDGTVREYGVWFRTTPQEAQEVIKTFDELWGKHKLVADVLGPRMTWFDAKNGIRVSTAVEQRRPGELDIEYVRYLPLARFFGEPGPLWGFEKQERPILDATVEELVAAYGKDAQVKHDEKNNTLTIKFPPTDYDGDTSVTMVLAFLDKGKVRQWRVNIPFEEYEPARAEYEAALEAKFGKPKPAKYEHLIYSKKPTVDVQYSKYTHDLNIEVKR